ncbi:sialin-like [Clytia hemisphaerica]|uniref:Sialin n=1 Tax=Clytia hemisphaerica TaxID=252671 RepID=A0A7M5VBT8_9CNID
MSSPRSPERTIRTPNGSVSYYYYDQSPRRSTGERTNQVTRSPKSSPEHNRTYETKTYYNEGENEASRSPKRGPGSGNVYSTSRGKRSHLSGEERRSPRRVIHKQLSNSIALPIIPDKRLTVEEHLSRRLSNSIAFEGIFESEKNNKNNGDKKTRKNNNDKIENGNSKPVEEEEVSLDDTKNSKNTTKGANDSSASDSTPTNIDETGENAKLLSVRRIGTPERDRKPGTSAGADSTSSSINDAEAPDVFLPKRYILAIMMFMGFVNMYAVRVNLNVAIGAMVNNHTVVKNGVAITVAPEFNWSSRLQGVVLGSFYYGYMFLQIPGGYFALKFGGTRIFGVGVLLASILTIFTPIATRYSVWALVVLRILEGLVLGVMLPCNHQIWASWAPLPERTTLVTIALAGMNVGTVVTMPLTGLLTKYGFDGGWASVFYCFGLFGIVWYILWFLVVHSTPATHPTISKKERQYIENHTVPRKSTNIPWCTMLSSKAVWAVIIGNITNDWGLYTILICLPIFLMDIMKFDIQTMGFIASLPFLLKAIVGPLGGVIADLLRYKYMSTINVRRLFFALGSISAAILIVVTGYSHSPIIAVVSMCLGVAMSGLLHSGYEVNILDIAPGLSGIVMGITNTAGTTTGFLSPLFVGFMTENKLRSEWIVVFWLTFFIYVIGTILYCLMLSGEAQHWSMDDEDEEARDNM